MTNTLPSNEFTDVSTDITNDQFPDTDDLSLLDIPLIEGEDAKDLEQFRASAIDAIKPRDAIEVLWLQDFICYAWESMRLRSQKTKMLINGRAHTLFDRYVYESDHGYSDGHTKRLTRRWAAGDIAAKEEVKAFLEECSLSEDYITNRTFETKLESIAKFDKLISHYDQRRDSAIKELEKRRDILAQRAYIFSQTFSDAAYEETRDGVVDEDKHG